MSAHIALPALGGDSTTPATLRQDVMTGLLRDSLGFTGLAITDALTMQGIGKGYTIEESVVQAVKEDARPWLNAELVQETTQDDQTPGTVRAVSSPPPVPSLSI